MSVEDNFPTPESLRAAMYENVAKGYAKVTGHTEQGEPIFAMTEKGEKYVREDLLDEGAEDA